MMFVSLMLFARDVDRTVGFYAALGLELSPVGDGRHIGDVGGVRIAVVAGSAGEPVARAGAPGTAMPGFAVSSIMTAVADAVACGGVVVREPEHRAWGIRAVVADPDGRTVEVVQHHE